MKITFITTFFTGATLPFVKHLRGKGYECNLYLLARQDCKGIETLHFDNPVLGSDIKTISKKNKIYQYLNSDIDINIVPFYNVANRKYLIGYIPYIKNIFIIRKLIELIKKDKSELIYVIVNEEHDAIIVRKLKRMGFKNVVIAYHEVVKSHIGKPELKKVVKNTCNLGFPLITYSEGTKEKLKQLTNSKKIYKIYFGPFEIFKLYNKERIVSEKYILFIGHITPYKGLNFLYETIKQYHNEVDCKIVVAGSGHDSCLEQINNDNKCILINKFLDDSEFASLVKYAEVIICPYVNGSQSGITHVAMLYNTPVIATKVGAFPEFIINGENGQLVDYGSHSQLYEAIKHYLENNSDNYKIPSVLQWENIISDFEKIIKDEGYKQN
jgi:glycosyltransferase involved in cell wall biosynthesis